MKRTLAYVYPVNEPKPVLAMVNYLRERIPKDELGKFHVKPNLTLIRYFSGQIVD